jgi:glutamine synthetase
MTDKYNIIYNNIINKINNNVDNNIISLEYVWIGGNNCLDFRSKTRTMYKKINNIYDIPEWNYDGSSTNQANEKNTEIKLKPVCMFNDPFRNKNDKIVLCETYNNDGTPSKNNTRYDANKIFNKFVNKRSWFGIEQEYFIYKNKDYPIGFDNNNKLPNCNKYYCSVGNDSNFGRLIAESHYQCCLYSGIKISGINSEVSPSQWEFQVGPCENINGADHLTIARFLLLRISELFNVEINFNSKPLKGDWNGSGCHVNFSTKDMRHVNGYDIILSCINKLKSNHLTHINNYGNNTLRLTGKNETSRFDEFSYGIGTRNTSLRIPNNVYHDKCGYIEDRRPSSDCDPYIVTSLLTKTCCN